MARKPARSFDDRIVTPADILYAVAILLLAYFVRGISGFGSGLIAVPLLALRFPLPDVVPFMLIMDFSASALVGGVSFKRVEWSEIRRLMPVSLIGVILGTSLLVSLPPNILLTVLSVFILAFAIRSLLIHPGRFRPVSTWWAYPAALTGGAVGGLFGTGGPPYVIYLSHRIQDKSTLRATLSGLFFLEGLIRIATFLAVGLLHGGEVWINGLMAAPIVFAALYAGSHVHARLSNAQMTRLIGLLLLGSAGSLMLKAWI
ncbi:MAG: hypothetical protein B7Y41_14975 [Hydrogenophilales bacterium 28-61-23]|nr:MAG: hypothetical protein B7Y41_14975 [Hydrogenophilales bacterium 28-61-23]